MKGRDYRGDVLTLQVVMDRAHSATMNGRRIESGPGSDLREAVVVRAAAHARRIGRPLPMVVHESKSECSLLVHPDGRVEALGFRGRQRAQRWVPPEHPLTRAAAAESGPLGSSRPTQRRASGAPAPVMAPASEAHSNLAGLPRYGERPNPQPSRRAADPDARERTAPRSFDDDSVRLAAQRLGLTPEALVAALSAAETGPEIASGGVTEPDESGRALEP